jgi:lipopolysaccharide cholinephosphotransferase
MSVYDKEMCRKVALEILVEVKRICEKHGIRYYLYYGTLLGAVRHQGFIPWDDDIDIAMPRKDYDRFVDLCSTELGDEYFLQTPLTEKEAYFNFTKVRKNGTLRLTDEIRHLKCHKGIGIDIFALDEALDQSRWLNRLATYVQCVALRFLVELRRSKLRITRPGVLGKALRVLLWGSSFVPISFYNKCIHRLMTLWNGRNTGYVVDYHPVYPIQKRICSMDAIYGSGILGRFETETFVLPSGYDILLRKIYGDYWILPPEEKRIGHRVTEVMTSRQDDSAPD